ncbi:MAG: elongation factor Ts [Acholeplasmataceae bacterium]|jgi:elongation factor Ts|nr:elongation factor Ts [Acholeplasmataceae bacterium]
MVITAKQVKALRDITGAGMLDCKKALEQTGGDIDKAVIYLREKGIAQAAKKSSRIAAEGLCNGVVDNNTIILYEVNSETDFVAKNQKFLQLIATVGEALLASKPNNTEEALEVVYQDKTIAELLVEATSSIGEKITLRRVSKLTKEASQTFGFYKHMGGKIVTAVVVKGSEEVAKNLAMHVAAQKPVYLNQSLIDESFIASEKEILYNQAIEENKKESKPKPENIIERMVAGRLNKQLKEISLVDQAYVRDPNITVSNYLKSENAKIFTFLRLEVGEGIEKREEDFAAEVSAQMKV